jgi:transglutaminase-like putative cysteine protease
VFAAVLPIRVALGEGLEVGRRVRLPVFDPSTLSTRTVEVRVLEHDTLVVPDSVAQEPSGRWRVAGEDTVPAWRVAEVFGGVSMESWIDAEGRVIRASSPLGFSMERTEFELARQALDDARGAPPAAIDEDVILATAIQSDVELGDVEVHDELRFVLRGVDLAGFDLDGGRQRLRGDTLVVRRERIGELEPGYDLPYPRMDLREALEPEPLVQSDDARIQEVAAEMAFPRRRPRSPDPRPVAVALNRGVYERLEKAITFSVPSALQVLESGRGDCNEHTVLYVALARALGLPARTAVGLVYVDGSFYYHAWPEVWLGEWVAVDPTFGQAPADAAHIRFIVGGLARQVEIIRLIGRLDIEVVEPGAGP